MSIQCTRSVAVITFVLQESCYKKGHGSTHARSSSPCTPARQILDPRTRPDETMVVVGELQFDFWCYRRGPAANGGEKEGREGRIKTVMQDNKSGYW